MVCNDCGGDILGDGYTEVFHCERAEIEGIEPDANIVFCGYSPEDDKDEEWL